LKTSRLLVRRPADTQPNDKVQSGKADTNQRLDVEVSR
jgi:hypothetical protein